MSEFEQPSQDILGSLVLPTQRLSFNTESINGENIHPYRSELQSYISSHHERLQPFETLHQESHNTLREVENNAANFLNSSDIAANFISSSEFQAISQKQKKELRGNCSIGLFVCIDGRLAPIIIGSSVFDIAETKAGLVPVTKSPLDNELELANPRIIESIIDRPIKENSEILQISTGHEESGNINCAAFNLMVENGSLPNDGTQREVFREMLANTGIAVGATFNRSARAKGLETLSNVGLTGMYDTRTAGFTFDGKSENLSTTSIAKTLLKSDDLTTIQRLGQPGLFRRNFTDPATLFAREQIMYHVEKVLMRQSRVFKENVDSYVDSNMRGYTENQKRAFRFFVARTVASQITTGLYTGGDHPFSSHNEQYISTTTNGLRVGEFDPSIQSFGANVASYEDSVSHLETKVALADQIGKMRIPHIAFLSESQPEKTTPSSDRTTRARLRAHMMAVMDSPDLLSRIKAGKLWLIPVILQEKNGRVKSIPNLAI